MSAVSEALHVVLKVALVADIVGILSAPLRRMSKEPITKRRLFLSVAPVQLETVTPVVTAVPEAAIRIPLFAVLIVVVCDVAAPPAS